MVCPLHFTVIPLALVSNQVTTFNRDLEAAAVVQSTSKCGVVSVAASSQISAGPYFKHDRSVQSDRFVQNI